MPAIRAREPSAAFTLVELILSLAISAIVLMAVASLLRLSTRAIPDEAGAQATAVNAGELLSRLAADAMLAGQVTETAADAVTFVVPDQTGDAAADTVRYVWSGVAGEPVARILNGSGRVDVVDGVGSFSLSYQYEDVPAYAELRKTTDAAATFQSSLPSVVASYNVASTIFAQVLNPSLPADAIAWTLDEVRLSLGPRGIASSTVTVEIRGCDAAGKPSSALYATTSVSESSLGLLGLLPSTRTFSFSGIMVPASERLCVVVRASGGDGSAALGAAGSIVWPADALSLYSNDGGSSWTPTTALVVGHSAAGRVVRLAGGESTRRVVARLGVALTAGSESWSAETGVAGRNPAEAP